MIQPINETYQPPHPFLHNSYLHHPQTPPHNSNSYMKVHGYLSLIICLFGCIANTLNIMVLTRREMRSPTNAILTGLAVADLLVMLDYIPYAVITNMLPLYSVSVEHRLSYSATWFVLLHSIFSQIYHTISIWLTVTLAIWRYIAVGYPQRNRLWCGMRTTMWAIASSYVVCPFIAIPLYASLQIAPKVTQLNETVFATGLNGGGGAEGAYVQMQRNVTVYRIEQNELANSRLMYHVNLWMYSVAIKLIPCVALTILSQRLIAALVEAKRRRKMLTTHSAIAMKSMHASSSKTAAPSGSTAAVGGGADGGEAVSKTVIAKSCKNLEKEKQTDRTTRMLLAVLLLFLITEFPQGILAVLASLLGPEFFMNCYLKLGKSIGGRRIYEHVYCIKY